VNGQDITDEHEADQHGWYRSDDAEQDAEGSKTLP